MYEAIKRLHEQIRNIGEYYDDNQIADILKDMGEFSLDNVADAFVGHELERPIRRCSWCGELMTEGYLLCDDYACCDECRNEIYKRDYGATTDEEAEIMYLKDCYLLNDEDVRGLTSEQISEKYKDYEVSDDYFWTSWE